MDSYSAGLTGLLVAGGIFIIYNTSQRSALPLVNGKRGSELRPIHAQKRFLADARNILKSGLSKVHPKKSCLLTSYILLNHYAETDVIPSGLCSTFSPKAATV